ncbi:hypothetical protein TREES_T100020392 [Tupaia chinensis]|uniref:Uncharacterized protein n=1 Tax=Tupaia chinensis TaxID=246437 RepID=L9KXB2_TUPCH|nr:hypothetical protein TREES_T100020392 [Tupaia chinensis]
MQHNRKAGNSPSHTGKRAFLLDEQEAAGQLVGASGPISQTQRVRQEDLANTSTCWGGRKRAFSSVPRLVSLNTLPGEESPRWMELEAAVTDAMRALKIHELVADSSVSTSVNNGTIRTTSQSSVALSSHLDAVKISLVLCFLLPPYRSCLPQGLFPHNHQAVFTKQK